MQHIKSKLAIYVTFCEYFVFEKVNQTRRPTINQQTEVAVEPYLIPLFPSKLLLDHKYFPKRVV